MDRFLDDAARILETAEAAERSGAEAAEVTILLGPAGMRLVAGFDGPLDRLRDMHGARTAYRVTRRGGRVRLEGCEPGRSCALESERPALAARLLLADFPRYDLATPQLPAAL